MGTRKMNFSRRPAQIKLRQIVEALEAHGPLTANELMERVPVVSRTMKVYLNYMVAQKLVHISGWTRQSENGLRAVPRAKYTAGEGRNREKPKPLTAVEARRRRYARAMDDPDTYPEEYLAFRREQARKTQRYRQERAEKLIKAGFPPELVRTAPAYIRAEGRFRTPTPDQVSEIIRLRDAGHSWTEIAEATNIPRSTVRAYYTRIAK